MSSFRSAFPVALEVVSPPDGIGNAVELRTASLEAEQECVSLCRDLLSPDERERADRFHFERDRRCFTVARAGLRQELATRLGREDPREIVFQVDAFGKPRLPGTEKCGIRFNLAHSGERVIYGFSEVHELGLDLEILDHVPRVADLASSIGCESEQRWLAGQPESRRGLGLLRLWTAKEAFLKAIGTGLHIEPNRLEVPAAVMAGADEPVTLTWLDEPETSAQFRVFPMPECESNLSGSVALALRTCSD